MDGNLVNNALRSVYNDSVKRQTKQVPTPTQIFLVAPLDAYALRVTTGLAYLGGLLVLPLLFAYLANMRWDGLLIPVALALAIAVFLLLTYAVQPRRYEITATELVVRRRLMPALRIPLKLVIGVSLASDLADVPRRGLRFAFNAGIFGYQGPFRLAPYGEVFFLATNRERLVAVARDQRTTMILSPERPRAFVEALQAARADYALEELVPSSLNETRP
ncbi:hypothetical protein EYB53_018505 [Candidatus Chloroploca sp. M-50]|uniref:Bacterial Pleckstrin homology domain-containing protein n=1 Tax=Candidatus Chloroploca mongolica TaxID=2528176 RepID=A0ABS4DE60_9CHLR|nr:hypothetical protein [Candidatus Chloroploca mongolica]